MRLVSKTWRAMTDEWAIPENLPAFFLIDIKEVAKVTEDCVNVGIEFLKRHAACFGMLRDLAGDLENFPEKSRDEGEWCVRIAFDITYDSPELERLQSCISAKARRVDIARPKSGPERNGEMSLAFYDVVSKILKPLKQATQLNLFQHYIINDNSQRLKNLFSHISVRGMYFTVNVQTCPKDFLIDMSELIKCFTIRLVKPQARESYSVRDKSASWVDIILAMFHCGACSIHLDTYCVDLFSSEDMQRIVEVLANRRSPFHLKAGIHQEPSRILSKAVKDIRKDIRQFGYFWRVSIWSKPPPMNSHPEVLENDVASLHIEDSGNFCLLSSLPNTIRWKIIAFVPESVGQMRLVSKSWCAMIDEWAIPENLPAVLNIQIKEETADSMCVIVEIYRKDAACFGRLRELAKKPDQSRPDLAHRAWRDFTFHIPYDSPDLCRLRDVISAKCDHMVDITRRGGVKGDDSGFYKAIAKLLALLKRAAQLRMSEYIGEENVKIVLDLTSHVAIGEVDLVVDSMTYPREILCNICERVTSIRFRLYNSQAEHLTSTTSLRDKSASWVELILAMFHAGAISVALSNHYVDVFSSEDIVKIAETLVERGTPFFLQVILHQKPTFMFIKGIRKEVYNVSGVFMVNIGNQQKNQKPQQNRKKNKKT